MGKSQRNKGYRGEYRLVKLLQRAGIPAKRVPLSGATSFQKGDVVIGKDTGEVKVRRNGFKQIYRWLEEHKYLFIKADRKEYLVVMRLKDFIRLWKEGGQNE
ncbi:hypothetical protein J7M07_04245 [bacterium]|nr:hypothetical protein [bacterium]